MANMSYCRFQNTVRDFLDCQDALEEMNNVPSSRPLSEYELDAANQLGIRAFNLIQMLAEELGVRLEDMSEDRVVEAITKIQEKCEN